MLVKLTIRKVVKSEVIISVDHPADIARWRDPGEAQRVLDLVSDMSHTDDFAEDEQVTTHVEGWDGWLDGRDDGAHLHLSMGSLVESHWTDPDEYRDDDDDDGDSNDSDF